MTASPSPRLTGVTFGAEIFSDPLDKDNGHGWPVVDEATYSAAFTGGAGNAGYFINFKQPGYAVRPHAAMRGIAKEQLRDYAVTVSAYPGVAVGSTDEFGVVCRDLRQKRYSFVRNQGVDHTITFSIFKSDTSADPGKRTDLATRTVPSLNHGGPITGVCLGGVTGPASLFLYTQAGDEAKPELLVQAQDSTEPLTEGFPGIYLGGGSTSKPRLMFNHFVVRAVSPA